MTGISREQWAALEPLMDQVLELPPSDRSAWLADLRAREPGQASQLETLLAADQTGAGLLDSPLEPPPVPLESLAGQAVGHYTLIRAIGHGGMGTVWLGRRSDGRYEGEVAIKLLNLALIGRAGEERFTQEGNLLARLTHPHIARLLDAGVAASGQPFLVLEHVDGLRIDQFVNQERYTVERRITLFLDVLDGVASAHANLVVHRDIKPSNIMVTRGGDVKLLDFGIAKMLTEGRAAAGPSSITVHDGRALTPEYAAPEQIRGEPVSTATDVYSLGVLLYVLLGGRHPTGEGCRTPVELLRAALDTEPHRLSEAVVTSGSTTREELEAIALARAATPERLQRLFLGDLDNILARALKKNPGERYQTVAAFADDLKRYLRHEPVSARPDSLAYRARKFVRRNRTAVIAAAVAVLSLIGATTVTLRQLHVARKERDRAADALRRSKASTVFESLIFRLIEPGGRPLTYEQLMDKGREVLDLHFRSDPRSRILVYLQFAQNYLRANEPIRADTILHRAVAIADSIHDLQWQGRTRCDLALTYEKRNVADSSADLVKQARTYLDRAHDVEDDNANFCDSAEAGSLMAAKKYDSAALVYARVADRIRAGGDTSVSSYSYSLNDYARALFQGGKIRAVQPVVTRLLEMVRSGSTPDPQSLVIMRFNTGATYDALGELLTLRDFFRRELDRTPEPDGMLLYSYAALLDELEQPDSAAHWFHRALDLGAALDGQRQCLARVRLVRIAAMSAGAVPVSRKEWDTARACSTPDSPVSTRAIVLAESFVVPIAGEDGSARARRIQRGLDSLGYSPHTKSRLFVHPLASAAQSLLDAGDFVDAARYAADVVGLNQLDSLALSRSGRVGAGLFFQARAERGQGHDGRARELARQAIAPLTFGFGADHPLTRGAVALADSLKAP